MTTPPLAQSLPIDMQPLAGKSALSLLWRWLRPWLALNLAGQRHLHRTRIDPAARRVLWIYKGTPQVGDALMDLSSRTLLRGLPLQLDLLTDPHLAQMFAADDVFSSVHSDVTSLDLQGYDLVILDSFKARCLRDKLMHLRRIPFVTMRGYFSGAEFNRTLFSFYRMQQLLGACAPVALSPMRPWLVSTNVDQHRAAAVPIISGALAVGVGGVVSERIYQHWAEVIENLFEQEQVEQVVLVGSANGSEMAQRIIARFGGAPRIIDCVGAFTLGASMEILRRCSCLACSDGGLMHLAVAAGTPVVALFDKAVEPSMRMTGAVDSLSMQSTDAVSALEATAVSALIATTLVSPSARLEGTA